jgi:hypothetical protein
MDEPLEHARGGMPQGSGAPGPVKVECLMHDSFRIAIRPAPQERPWMDATPEQFAYRCLPLNIANAHNWEILAPAGFRARWNGGPRIEDITVEHDEPHGQVAAMSHFGSGVLTIPISGLFRTDPGYDLWVMGPVNRPKADIQALSAVIETDWLPFTFTMNWIFTRPGEWVRFDKGEPVCAFFPVPRGLMERCTPTFGRMDDEPDLAERFKAYRESRLRFNEDLKVPGSEARAEKWQKTYFRGPGDSLTAPHRTKLRAKPFKPLP